MRHRFIRATHVGGAPRTLSRAQREAWDAGSAFVGELLPERPVTFWELVALGETWARARREDAPAPEELAMQLVALIEVDLVHVVPDKPRRRGPRGTQS